MSKIWAGRTDGVINAVADDFNSSISFDKKMFEEDITGSIAHAKMLAKQEIITLEDCQKIVAGLSEILTDLKSGKLQIDETAEDIHTFVEGELTSRIGDAGKKLHTARSRNDQVAVDLRLFLKKECKKIIALLLEVLEGISYKAEEYKEVIMPGYTHLQRAQPILFSHHILAYAEMLKRDISRLKDTVKRLNVSPLGSCALAGTTFNTDRNYTASLLGFDGANLNSIDGVSDRDYCVELLADFSIIMMHLSRFSEELILWSSLEFKFIEISSDFTTGSSIMPQKKNSDMAELIRGKTGRVYGDLIGTLTMLKGLPLAYNKDMQEDKESIFDGVNTVKKCLQVFAPMIKTIKVLEGNMYKAANKGFINATDLADYLAKKGMPFRTAYKIVGELVGKCVLKDISLDELTIEELKTVSDLIEEDVYEAISLKTCVKKRVSYGGTSYESVQNQIKELNKLIENEKSIY